MYSRDPVKADKSIANRDYAETMKSVLGVFSYIKLESALEMPGFAFITSHFINNDLESHFSSKSTAEA